MNTFRAEWRKIVRQKIVIFGLLLLLAVNVIHIEFESRRNGMRADRDLVQMGQVGEDARKYHENHWKFADMWRGPITPERIAEFMEAYQVAQANKDLKDGSGSFSGSWRTDSVLYYKMREKMMRLYQIADQANAVALQARSNLADPQVTPYDQLLNESILNAFVDRSVDEYADLNGANILYMHSFTALLCLMVIVLGLSPLFTREIETGMDQVIRISRRGGLPTTTAKLMASALFVGLVCLLMMIVELLAFVQFYHLQGLNLPIYALPTFVRSPLRLSIGETLLLGWLLRFLGCLCWAAIVALISTWVRESSHVLLGSLAALAVLFVAAELPSGLLHDVLTWINPLTLLEYTELLQHFTMISIFGFPIQLFIARLGAGLVIAAGLFACVLWSANRKRRGQIRRLSARAWNQRQTI